MIVSKIMDVECIVILFVNVDEADETIIDSP